MRYILLDLMPIILFIHPPPDRPDAEAPEDSKGDVVHFSGTSELFYIYKELKFISDRMREQDYDGSYEDEWKYAALVLDRYRFFRKIFWNFLKKILAIFLVTPQNGRLFFSFFFPKTAGFSHFFFFSPLFSQNGRLLNKKKFSQSKKERNKKY